tara:strand:+ start:184 stop:822 length:639 start_codon:yes stop_codon:yes gene_type:complete
MFKGYFISGNDTNVGKTIVSAILVNKLEANYFKPIQCGKNEFSKTDSDVVKKFCPNSEIIPETYFFKDPISPNIASKKEKRKISIKKILEIKKKHFKKKIIIEGAGGLQVPINNKYLMSDLVKKIDFPLILVCKTSLGTINHSLLSIELIKNKKINFKGIIFVGKNIVETVKTIEFFGKKILGKKINVLGNIPFKKKISVKQIKNFGKLLKI